MDDVVRGYDYALERYYDFLDVPVKAGNSVIMSNTFNDGTTIATVANMNDLIFRGNIDETEVGRIHEGMPVKITLGALQNMEMCIRDSFSAEDAPGSAC